MWTSNGSGFAPYELWGTGARPQDMLADVNADGRTDVVELYENGNAYMWQSSGTAYSGPSVRGTGAPDSSGDDTFVFGPGFGQDRLRDFTPGASGGDVLQFDDVGFMSFNDVMSHAVQRGPDTVITVIGASDVNGPGVITLENVLKSLLTPDDMIFT